MILPRQARDKHRENSKKSGVFRRGAAGGGRGADRVRGGGEHLRAAERGAQAVRPAVCCAVDAARRRGVADQGSPLRAAAAAGAKIIVVVIVSEPE